MLQQPPKRTQTPNPTLTGSSTLLSPSGGHHQASSESNKVGSKTNTPKKPAFKTSSSSSSVGSSGSTTSSRSKVPSIQSSLYNSSTKKHVETPRPGSRASSAYTPLSNSSSTKESNSSSRCSSPSSDTTTNIGRTGELINTFKNVFKDGEVKCCCYVDKTSSIWTGGNDCHLCIYDIKDNIASLDFKRISVGGHLGDISKSSFSCMTCVNSLSQELACTVWTGFNNGKLLVWDAVSITKIFELHYHSAEITQIICVFNEITKSKFVWTCSQDSSICIIALSTFQPECVLNDQTGPIRSMVFLNHSHQVWTCSDTSIYIRSTDGKTLKQIPFSVVTRHVIFDGHHIWTSSVDGKLRVWDCETQKCIKETKAHSEMVNGLLCTTKQVWSCGDDKVLHIFDSTSLKPIKKIKANSVSVINMVALPGKRIFAFCTDNKVRIWECEGEIQCMNDLMTALEKHTETLFKEHDEKQTKKEQPSSLQEQPPFHSLTELETNRDDYESSSEDDDNSFSLRSIKESYENEIVKLRKQLQETSSLVTKYKLKLKSKTEKIEEQQVYITEKNKTIEQLQEEVKAVESLLRQSMLQCEKEKLEREELVNKISSVYLSFNGQDSTVPSNNDNTSVIKMIDELLSITDMERSKIQQLEQKYQNTNIVLHETTKELQTKLDSASKDTISLIEHLKHAKEENEHFKELITEKENTIRMLKSIPTDEDYSVYDEIEFLDKQNEELITIIEKGFPDIKKHLLNDNLSLEEKLSIILSNY
ncbi:hypothetical protein C9374_000152 [Naegleria lovaniensis]|uniref:Guanine nucleotide-binding protein subunit beta-like protein n=1 Tax=Naegleria lovaniensis TaxID=51637 RepID=A0AA88GYH8_NAELO|nr:uncharacterized protein C9374_000152 [Naegleria lovaniensis]KAG2388713.1 hypothetical protein C9374_000152 [Naegleria lovaniensis]